MRVAFFKRPDARVMHGQVFVLDENDDLDRSDIDSLLELVDGDPGEDIESGDDDAPDGGEGDDQVEDDEADIDRMSNVLSKMNIEAAKKFLSKDGWTAETMELALQGEENGKNREGVKEFMEGRISQLREMEEDD